jgi:hypothetical protein
MQTLPVFGHDAELATADVPRVADGGARLRG